MKIKIMLVALFTLLVGVKVARAESQFMLDPNYIKSSTVTTTAKAIAARTATATLAEPANRGWVIGVQWSTGTCGDWIELRDSLTADTTGTLIVKAYNVIGSTQGAPSTDSGKTGCQGQVIFPIPLPFSQGLSARGLADYLGGASSQKVLWYRKP